MRYFGTMKNNDGLLEIGGISVKELAETHGTPLYIMDQQLIEDNIKKYIDNFKSNKFQTEIVYASKAFLSKGICQIVNKYGLSIDAVSGGEMFAIKAANFPMNRVHLHGNNKSLEELQMAVDYGVGIVILDNEKEIVKLNKIGENVGKTIDVMLRINIGIDAHTHEYIRTTKHTSKFGESIFDEKIYDIIKSIVDSKNLNFLGFHCHIGSQIFDTTAFHQAIESMIGFTKTVSTKLNITIPEMNLGGGFGVYYTDGDVELDIEKFMISMINHIENTLEKENLTLERVSIEPGRSIVANAGGTLYTVGETKDTYGGVKYAFIDGGMTDNIRPALYQAKYEAIIANKLNIEPTDVITIAGKCCESGDLIAKDVLLAPSVSGDYIYVATTGAYGYSMSSNYNKATRPAVVFVKDGKSQISVKRETYEDLVMNDFSIDI